jgi:hypothetical protein
MSEMFQALLHKIVNLASNLKADGDMLSCACDQRTVSSAVYRIKPYQAVLYQALSKYKGLFAKVPQSIMNIGHATSQIGEHEQDRSLARRTSAFQVFRKFNI